MAKVSSSCRLFIEVDLFHALPALGTSLLEYIFNVGHSMQHFKKLKNKFKTRFYNCLN